jgi:ADP-ribose pyrophosphatase YjhB (NUDIX family)
MKRAYPDRPIVGVSAVIFDEMRVLLVKRDKEPGKDQWNLPGGAVELGEILEDALKREIIEEASVEIKIGGLVGVFDSIIVDPKSSKVKYHYTLIDYWGWISSGKPKAGSDVSEVKWVPLEEIESYGIADSAKKAIYKAAEIQNNRLEGEKREVFLTGSDIRQS